MASASPIAIQLRTSFTANRVLCCLLLLLPRDSLAPHSTTCPAERCPLSLSKPCKVKSMVPLKRLETPVTSSPLVAWYLSNLPAYRTAVSPLIRGVEVGLAHGRYFLVGPFVKAGPLRKTDYAGAAGSLAAGGLVAILSICLTIYGISSFKEGEPSIAPALTLTGRKNTPDQLQTAEGWV